MATAESQQVERRAWDRSQGIPLRRRQQLEHTGVERRRRAHDGFDIAAALEHQLDRFPSRGAMIVLLKSWLYGGAQVDGDYVDTVSHALDVMRAADDVESAIAVLRRRQH